jgi:hypothetical protein
MKLNRFLVLLFLVLLALHLHANESIVIHAIYKESFACTEHWAGQFKHLGDALGSDCVIKDWYKDDQRMFQRSYKNNGFENKDWYGFNKEVLAPCDCVIEKIHINPETNEPGIMKPGRASSITFKTPSDSRIVLAHVKSVSVTIGQQVKGGEVVARVGNNGYSRNPHIHIGAWNKDKQPLQVQFDPATLGLIAREKLKRK